MHVFGTIALALAAAGSASEPVAPVDHARSPARIPVQIEMSGNPKFSAEELTAALAPRLPPDAPEGTLSVSVRHDGLIELAWQSRKRAVDLGEETGPAAARVAALLAADLFLPFGLPLVVTPSTIPAPASEKSDLVSLALGYGLWSGDGHGPLLQGPSFAAGFDRRYLRLRAEGAWLRGAPHPLIDQTAWPLRLGAGVGTSYISLFGALVMVPYRLEGVANLTRTLMGTGLGLESRFPIAAGFSLRVDAGVDLLLGKGLHVAVDGITFFDSPTWAWRFGAALAWGRAR